MQGHLPLFHCTSGFGQGPSGNEMLSSHIHDHDHDDDDDDDDDNPIYIIQYFEIVAFLLHLFTIMYMKSSNLTAFNPLTYVSHDSLNMMSPTYPFSILLM